MMDNKIEPITLRNKLLSDENIFLSIYMVDSYIQNKELLCSEDRKLFHDLRDILDDDKIAKTIQSVKNRINDIMEEEHEFFEATVYFKPKKYEDEKIVFRPLHTASLIDQIAMVAMLQILVYDIDDDGKIYMSDLSRLIPSNFYGNRVAFNIKRLFKPWQEQYKEYTGKANELLSIYCETLEYKYEVSLDLENFFPSIDPTILYEFVASHLPVGLSFDDAETIKKILKKLLFIRLSNLEEEENKWYLTPKDGQDFRDLKLNKKCGFVKGVAQGLPHSYFFANLFMLRIKEIYAEQFPGKMLFYVDDSVIFTDVNLDDKVFEGRIDEINNSIQNWEKGLSENKNHSINLPLNYCYVSTDFGVKVHGSNGKSAYSEITDAKENSGERFLRGLSRETSKIGFDMFTVFSDEEVGMMQSRTKAILGVINKEIERVQEGKEVYLKKLYRYKKYFGYRATILTYRTNGEIMEIKKELIRDISPQTAMERDWEKFFEKYNDDILAATISFVFKKCSDGGISTEDLSCAVRKLESDLYRGNSDHSYIKKAYEPYLEGKIECYEQNSYNSLQKVVAAKCKAIREQSQKVKYEKVSGYLKWLDSDDYEELYRFFKLDTLFKRSKYIRVNSDELVRMILNCIYSYVFCYEIDESFTLAKKSRDPIDYVEIRVIAYLRNKHFSVNVFRSNFPGYTNEDYKLTADYSLLQVLDVFKTFVSRPEWIDNLILAHKYCCDTWKNGSKYLHFYTLHNQEHAICLIRSAVKLVHGVSYFQPKQIDYYILFIACYLHDIAMVTLPNVQHLYNESYESNIIYSKFMVDFDSLKKDPPTAVRKLLYDYYKRIDEYFETDIRRYHAKNSASEIRKHHELSFIEEAKREIIAEVTEAHCFDIADIYHVKSDGHTALVNRKLIKILLRLCDLLDMSRYRISNLILKHNLENLNEVSRFHWISHLVTDGYDLSTVYTVSEDTIGSYLKNRSIIETLVLKVNVLLSQTSPINPKNKCKNISSSRINKDNNGTSLSIICESGKECDNRVGCNFLCKWFVTKNNFLFAELAALGNYLNSLEYNYYRSETKVIINVSSRTNISTDVFDYLRDYVEKN